MINQEGDTPLHIAIWNLDEQRIKDLVSKGAQWNIKNNKGETALDLLRNELCLTLPMSDKGFKIRRIFRIFGSEV